MCARTTAGSSARQKRLVENTEWGRSWARKADMVLLPCVALCPPPTGPPQGNGSWSGQSSRSCSSFGGAAGPEDPSAALTDDVLLAAKAGDDTGAGASVANAAAAEAEEGWGWGAQQQQQQQQLPTVAWGGQPGKGAAAVQALAPIRSSAAAARGIPDAQTRGGSSSAGVGEPSLEEGTRLAGAGAAGGGPGGHHDAATDVLMGSCDLGALLKGAPGLGAALGGGGARDSFSLEIRTSSPLTSDADIGQLMQASSGRGGRRGATQRWRLLVQLLCKR